VVIPRQARKESPRYRVRLSVPRNGGLRAWGKVSGDFERRLAEHESQAVTGAQIESETRRGRDQLRVTIAITVIAPDVAQALAAAWWVFRKAVSDDAAGWDMADATADIRPDAGLTPARPHLGVSGSCQMARLRARWTKNRSTGPPSQISKP
jgi:hypothetical protein